MGKIHLLNVFHQIFGKFRIGHIIIVGFSLPRSQMNFINSKWFIQGVFFLPGLHPAFVSPFVFIFPNYRCRHRWMFTASGKGVCLFRYHSMIRRVNNIFVQSTFSQIGHKSLPDTTSVPAHIELMVRFVPIVKIAHNGNRARRRRPNGKISAFYPVDFNKVGSQLFI